MNSINLKQVKGNFQRLFDKNLTDLVRGLRNNKDNEVRRLRGRFRSGPDRNFFAISFKFKTIHIIKKNLSPTSFFHFQANYIAQCIEEIKQELRIDNIGVKCNAVAKLTYVSRSLSDKTQ